MMNDRSILMNDKTKICWQNVPGIWPQIHRHARECFEDAACNVHDLPTNGKYAMVHVSPKEETMSEQKPSTVRWSLVLNDSSSLLDNFPRHFIDVYRHMDSTRFVAVFIYLEGANKAQYWAMRIFHRSNGI